MKTLKFVLPGAEQDLVERIVSRALALRARNGVPATGTRLRLTMDLVAAHANGCPLQLAELLAADDFNFSHDVFGIERHIDRQTGQLGDGFLPRFAVKQDVEDEAAHV